MFRYEHQRNNRHGMITISIQAENWQVHCKRAFKEGTTFSISGVTEPSHSRAVIALSAEIKTPFHRCGSTVVFEPQLRRLPSTRRG